MKLLEVALISLTKEIRVYNGHQCSEINLRQNLKTQELHGCSYTDVKGCYNSGVPKMWRLYRILSPALDTTDPQEILGDEEVSSRGFLPLHEGSSCSTH